MALDGVGAVPRRAYRGRGMERVVGLGGSSALRGPAARAGEPAG
jgi:hypothetical protein